MIHIALKLPRVLFALNIISQQSQRLRAHWLTLLFRFYFALPNGNTKQARAHLPIYSQFNHRLTFPSLQFLLLVSWILIYIRSLLISVVMWWIYFSMIAAMSRDLLNSKAYFLSFTNSPLRTFLLSLFFSPSFSFCTPPKIDFSTECFSLWRYNEDSYLSL